VAIREAGEYQDKELKRLTDDFARVEGRRPRVLVALTKSELSGQFNEISSTLADLGFDVDISPRFQSAESLVRQAAENDVHVLLVLASEALIDELVEHIVKELNTTNESDVLLIVKTDSSFHTGPAMKIIGNTTIFGSQTSPKIIAKHILQTFAEKN
jgi:methylmalonyl-CoA mutase